METGAILSLLLAAVPLMGSPGPATISLAAMGTAFGFRRSGGYLLGIVLGTTAVLLMIATGLTGLVLAIPGIVPVLVVIAGAYIIYLAYRIATSPVMSEDRRNVAEPSLAGGLLLAIANPKAYAAIGAVYAGSTLIAGDSLVDAFAKVAVLTLVIIAVNSTWLALGSVFASLFRNLRAARVINIAFAVLLLASIAMVIAG